MDNLFRLENARFRHEQIQLLLEQEKAGLVSVLANPENEDLVQSWIKDGKQILDLLEQYRARVGVTYPVMSYALEQDGNGTPTVVLDRVCQQGLEGWKISRSGIHKNLPQKNSLTKTEWFRMWNGYLFSSSTQALESWHKYEEQMKAEAEE